MHIRMRTCIYARRWISYIRANKRALFAQVGIPHRASERHPSSCWRAGIHASFTSEGRSFTDTKQKAKLCRKEGYFLTGQELIYRRQAVYCEERKQGKWMSFTSRSIFFKTFQNVKIIMHTWVISVQFFNICITQRYVTLRYTFFFDGKTYPPDSLSETGATKYFFTYKKTKRQSCKEVNRP